MDENLDNLTLSELFNRAWSLQIELETNNDSLDKQNYEKWKKAIDFFERCSFMLDELHLFSDNESLDEVSSSELRYFLCPVLLAWLQIQSFENNKRIENLAKAKLNYLKFFKITKDYGLNNYAIPEDPSQQSQVSSNLTQKEFDQNLLAKSQDRNEKIRRFKEMKETEKELETMKAYYKTGNMNDEQKREFHMKMIKYWLSKSVDDYKILLDELRLLSRYEKNEIGQAQAFNTKPKTEPMKPYVITRDVMQAKVFGLGYPSLPVYSIDQFYDQLCDKGMMPTEADDGKEKSKFTKLFKRLNKNKVMY
jgi:immunoglobulin-binding protein 1